MSNQEFEQAKANVAAIARKVHDAARIVAMDGRPINKDWIDEGNYVNSNEVTKKWEKCTIKLEVKDARSYSERIDLKLDDGTVLLSTYYYISGSGNSEFEVSTFRNGAWVERLITYSKEDVIAEKERKEKAELEERLKPFSEIDF